MFLSVLLACSPALRRRGETGFYFLGMFPELVSDTTTPERRPFELRHFLIPREYSYAKRACSAVRVCAIIPTYAPKPLLLELIGSLIAWNPGIVVYVVDDCTPRGTEGSRILTRVASLSDQVIVLRTPLNTLKAGALNYALQHIFNRSDYAPDVVVTLDDDVVIDQSTIPNLVSELVASVSFGAVCSQCRVHNKNKNILTRLQGLEYLGFNAIRLADEGLYRGPLVMHGMLTAFRAHALRSIGGFTKGHLIEDYEITTRLKEEGWSVKSAQNAPAWTVVPETLRHFWRQRTRWSYGGITVVTRTKRPLAVFQDLIGHFVFIATLGMVFALFFLKGNGQVPAALAHWIIALSFIQLGIWYAFQMWIMRLYKEKDRYDWIIRAALVPEFLYSYAMTLALIGSYIFHSFNTITRIADEKGSVYTRGIVALMRSAFRVIGYTERSWNTRHSAQTS